MDQLERTHSFPAASGGGGGSVGGGNLQAMRQDGQAFHAACSAAIDRALSTDSGKFLEANRQQSGQ